MTTTDREPEVLSSSTAPDPKRWIALGVIAIAQLMIVLDASIVNIAIPSAAKDLDISRVNQQWIVTAYTLAFGGLLLLGGRIADFNGRKRTFMIGLIGFAAASALGGIAPNEELLFAARALQGAFAAIMAPAALSLITVTFTLPKERAKAFGVFGAISGGGAAIGLIVGGVLTEYANWRWCLLVNVPIAIGTAIAAASIVKESKAVGDHHYDIPGAVLATTGLVSLVYGFTEAAKEGWSSTTAIIFLAVAAVLIVSFVVTEMRVEHPLLPLRVVLDRNRGGSYLVFLMVGAGMFAMFLFLTFYLQYTLDYSPLRSGFAFLPFSLGIIVTAGISAQLLPKFGPRPLMITGLTLGTLSMFALTRITVDTSYFTHVLPFMLTMSIGMALTFIPTSSTALTGVDQHDAGIASAVLNTSQQIGGALGTALMSTFFASASAAYIASHVGASNEQGSPADVHGYHIAFVTGGIFLFCALLSAIFLINVKKAAAPVEGAVAVH